MQQAIGHPVQTTGGVHDVYYYLYGVYYVKPSKGQEPQLNDAE